MTGVFLEKVSTRSSRPVAAGELNPLGMEKQMQSLAEELLHTTVRLEGCTATGTSVGTGFFFMHDSRLFVVTNKHVVEGVTAGTFVVLNGQEVDGKNLPLFGNGIAIPFSKANFIGHPDPEVDVAAMNVSAVIDAIATAGSKLFWKNLSEKEFPTEEHFEKFIGPMEEVVFVGYPSGLWDHKNILPITRRGMTATPCYVDFNGTKTFLIDASVFPGSSGSPVFIYYAGGHPDKQGNLYAGNRMHFMGIVAKVYQRLEQGEIRAVDIPTTQKYLAEINQMIDLGIVYKAETIKECVEHYVRVATGSSADTAPVLSA